MKTKTPKLYSINSLSEVTGVDRRTLKKYLAGITPDKMRGRFAFYSLATINQALNGTEIQIKIPEEINPLRILFQEAIRNFFWHQSNLLPFLWDESTKDDGIPPAASKEILDRLWLGLCYHSQQYVIEDYFNRCLAQDSGLKGNLDHLAEQLTGVRTKSEPPTEIETTIPQWFRDNIRQLSGGGVQCCQFLKSESPEELEQSEKQNAP